MERLEKNIITNRACLCAAALGALCIACMTADGLVAGMGAILRASISVLLWTVKFVGCILVMQFFMKKLCRDFDGVTYRETRRLGILSALFSAILTAGFTFIYMTLINPDLMTEQVDQILDAYSSMLDSNTISTLEKSRESLPVVSLVSNFIYCFLYGTILASILARNCPSSDPFAQDGQDAADFQAGHDTTEE